MIIIEMPIKDFTFLKQHYDDIDRYFVSLSYSQDDVSFEIQNEKLDNFLLDYRSTVVRKGSENEQTINDIGVRLNYIYDEYIRPNIPEEVEEETEEEKNSD